VARVHALILATTLGLASCGHGRQPDAGVARAEAAPAAAAPATTWLTRLDRDHPLVGRLWSVRRRAFAAPDELVRDAVAARFVMLGERHDNPDHHRLQAEVLSAMVARGRRPAVAFEMFDTGQQEAIDRYRDRYRADRTHDASGLGPALDWSKTGWPPWTEYLPIAEVAFRDALPIVAANLPLAQVRALVHGQPDAMDAAARARLGLDRPLPADAERALLDELRASHCGHIGERMLPPMLLAQRARDAQMAERLRADTAADGAVLIAGAGHARLDRGVPWYLGQSAPDAAVVSIAFTEVDKTVSDAARYVDAPAGGAAGPSFDYLWFTPRASDEDHCAVFEKGAIGK